jgi:chemotaxis-related protein WspB
MGVPVLYLVIQLGRDRYALDASQVTEIVPLVRVKSLPGAPRGAVGLMNYRGVSLPVVDLNLLATGGITPVSGATRIVVVRYAAPQQADGGGALGLLVPDTRETLRLDPDSFSPPGVAADGAPYLGDVLATPEGVLQRVTVNALMTDELRDALYRASVAA